VSRDRKPMYPVCPSPSPFSPPPSPPHSFNTRLLTIAVYCLACSGSQIVGTVQKLEREREIRRPGSGEKGAVVFSNRTFPTISEPGTGYLLLLSFKLVLTFFFWFCTRIAHLTSCSRPLRSKSRSREIWESRVQTPSVIVGFSSSMEMNAVDQWRLRLLCTTAGLHLSEIPICFITDHLRGTVRTSHRARLE